MRLIEWAFLGSLIPALWGSGKGFALLGGSRSGLILPLILLGGQLVFVGPRWQFLPAYLLLLWLGIASTWDRIPHPGVATALIGSSALVVAALLATWLPVFQLPRPTGPLKVGSTIRHLVDVSREETRSHRFAHRELMIQIWYPTDQDGPRQPYRAWAETTWKKQQQALVKTQASVDVPVSRKQDAYPVILFLPSWHGRRNQNVVQAEELASHGFVVVGIDHPFSTEVTAFPDGRKAWTTLDGGPIFDSEEAVARFLRIADEEMRIRTADARFVLDELESLNRSDPQGILTGRLTLDEVGAFGHSLGGSVSAELCRRDPRVVAGVNLDGWHLGPTANESIETPFLVLFSDGWIPTPADVERAEGHQRLQKAFDLENVRMIEESLSHPHSAVFEVQGASHANFCDSPFYSPLKRLTGAGSIDHLRAIEITNGFLLTFFRSELQGDAVPTMSHVGHRFPEVTHRPGPH